MRAADRLNCSPWELEEQSLVWTWRALLAEQAEGKAADAAAKRARRKG